MEDTANQDEDSTGQQTDLDVTNQNADEGYTERVSDINSDIDGGFFYNNVQVSRRTLKNKQLKNELFDDTVYSQNQCGFTTSRQLFWVSVLNNYIDKCPNVQGKFMVKYPKSTGEKCQYLKILIHFEIGKKVEILINTMSGVLMVKGNNYKLWITKQFPRVLQLYNLNLEMIPNDFGSNGARNESTETIGS